jgi:hypothetical protein
MSWFSVISADKSLTSRYIASMAYELSTIVRDSKFETVSPYKGLQFLDTCDARGFPNMLVILN